MNTLYKFFYEWRWTQNDELGITKLSRVLKAWVFWTIVAIGFVLFVLAIGIAGRGTFPY